MMQNHYVRLSLASVAVFAGVLSVFWAMNRFSPGLTDPCWPRGDFDCHLSSALETLHQRGALEAQRTLRSLYEAGRMDQNDCHKIAHAVGEAAFRAVGDIEEALRLATNACSGGYYHGVMKGFFGDKIDHGVVGREVESVCASFGYHTNGAVSCFHGLGHALMYATGNDLPSVLTACDRAANNDEWRRSHCYDGAFMANAFSPFSGSIYGSERPSKYLSEDDLLYPCDAVAPPYRLICYFRHVPLRVLTLSPERLSLGEIATHIPEEFATAFWFGIGRETDILMRGNWERIVGFCAALPRAARGPCFGGAALHMVAAASGTAGRYTLPYAFCASLPDDADSAACRKGLGLALGYPANLASVRF